MGAPRIEDRPCDTCGELFHPRRRFDHHGALVRFCSRECHWASYGVEGRTEKACSRCGLVKSIDCFQRDHTTADGLKAHCKECASLYQADYSLRRNYGITLEDYHRMLDEQDGVCPICGRTAVGVISGKSRASVDHDHETGDVRALLCGTCNLGIGQFQENPEWLENAAAYLRRHKGEQVG